MQINKLLTNFNHESGKVSRIKYIVIHYVGALGGAKANCEYYAERNRNASAHYFVDFDGSIWQSVEDKNIAWHCGSASGYKHVECRNANSIGIEMCVRKANTKTLYENDKDWYFEDATVKSTIELTKMLIQKYKIPAERILRHYDVTGKICPNPFVYNHTKHTWSSFKNALTSKRGLQATELLGMSEEDIVAKIGPLCTADMKKTGVLASLTMAQFILECGYGKTELAQNANNCFGMKTVLSGNTWAGSAWDGKSVYEKSTAEWVNGAYTNIIGKFRKYDSIEESIADHSAYLLNSKNGNNIRYAGLKGEKDYRKAATIVKNGGYATSPDYIDKLCARVERWNLTQYDILEPVTYKEVEGTLKVIYDGRDGIEVHNTPDFEASSCNKNHGPVGPGTNKGSIFTVTHLVTLPDGIRMYKLKSGLFITAAEKYVKFTEYSVFKPYKVRVNITDLNIRTGPGTNYTKTGHKTGIGEFTIVEEKTGKGSDTGWGRLKSGAGWISLDFATRV